jgi:DNA polymerase III delta prime subunit
MNLADLPKHHAVLVLHTNRTATAHTLFKELQSQSPIHRFFDQTVLDIENARSIITWANTPYNEEKVAVISFHTIGLEAQNALLKILEEPRAGVTFILVTSNTSNLIPTVLSRLYLIKTSELNSDISKEALLFLQTPSVSRMKLPYIVDILSRVDEEERKDREAIRAFILSLTGILVKEKYSQKYLQETLEIASYASDPSASGKALLEYLSLLLPQIKV